jgi:alcohol oxidase
MPSYRGEFAPLHPKYPEGSAAACVKLDSAPQVSGLKNIVYTAEDNAAIEAFVRQMCETTWHSVSSHLTIGDSVCLSMAEKCATVPMKPREDGGCVDARLNVYGTQNLKVAGTCPSCSTRNIQLIVSGRPLNYPRKRWR